MRTLSRRTGGRRGARLAAVFAGTLLTYLVATAVPAAAVASSCSVSGNVLTVQVGTDDRAVLDPGMFDYWGTGDYQLLVDGLPAPIDCGVLPGGLWVNILGANDGNEHLVLYTPAAMASDNVTVDLGNGTDKLELAYAETTWTDFFAVVTLLPDLSFVDELGLGTAPDGTLVGDMDYDGVGDLRIDDAENIVVGMGFDDDTVDAQDQQILARSVIPGTGDDIPASVSFFSDPVTFNGGPGDDTFVSGAANDVFNGGADFDHADFDGSYFYHGNGVSAGVTVDLQAGTATGSATGNDVINSIQAVWGTDGADSLTGSNVDNVLVGRVGADTLTGAAGNDTIDGGPDNDTFSGGPGNDTLGGFPEPGDDTFLEDAAANGADTVFGGIGKDTVDLSGRTNSLYVAPGAGSVSGEGGCPLGAGCEKDFYSPTNEIYLLGSGNDTFVGSGANERVVPGAGDDSVDGNGGFDYLDLSDAAGPATFDLTTGQATGNGTDTFADMEGFVGTAGDDTVIFDDGLGCSFGDPAAAPPPSCDFIGGAGIDTLDGSATTAGFKADLRDIGNGHDVENVIGGSGDDDIVGNDAANALFGGDGFDFIDAKQGNDTVEGGLDNDTLFGGDGGDTLVYTHSTAGMIIDNQLGFTQGIGGVGDGQDDIEFFEIVLGSDFGDEITAGQTAFDANNRLLGRGGDDTLIGTNSSDLLKGGAGDDYQRGGGGDDDVYGGAGDDILLGSSGDDFLKGGKGSDTGNGGRGADICKSVEFPKSC